MSTWYTYRLVQNNRIKVTIDGQGADEQLSGYILHYAFYITWLPLRNLFQETYQSLKTPGAFPYIWRGFLANIARHLCGKKLTRLLIKKFFKRDIRNSFNEHLHHEFSTSLVNLFNIADRGSMAHSVEARMPYVDYRLVEFLASVPAAYKIHKGWTKYLARLAFDKKLPDAICWRRDKMGWPVPDEYWFCGPLKSWMEHSIQELSEAHGELHSIAGTKVSASNIKKAIRILNLNQAIKVFTIEIMD